MAPIVIQNLACSVVEGCRRLCTRKAFRSGLGTKTCEQRRCVEVWGIADDGGAAQRLMAITVINEGA